ncbi:MAG: hypothetical protein JWR72_3405 [Flavisolibacter sp.]|nr:hypothetical protein [Flavisolibacter sp.]
MGGEAGRAGGEVLLPPPKPIIFPPHNRTMKQIINIINQVFEIEKKLGATSPIQRNLDRIKSELTDMGYEYHNPVHEKWDETRTDCEASVAGTLKSKMIITEVIKPVVHHKEDSGKKLVQKAIVVVE